jgi:hypothetical protein
MKFLLLAASIAFTAVSCQQRNNTANTGNAALPQDSASASSANADTGWQNLFNGHSLAGWHTYGKTTAGNAWKADSGTIHLDASASEGRGDLITDKEYGDFDLKLEWKISPNGNSGILFYVKEDTSRFDETYKSGPEMQVLDNNGHPDGKILKHRAGNLYDLIASNPESAKGPGEWNTVEIISKNSHLELYLNGVKGVSTTLWNDAWNKMIAGSKFKNMPGWGSFKTGHIALQDHGNDVWYRNIMIKKL